MSAPTNISALTATAMSTNQTITQRVDDAGTTYTVWFKMLADVDGVVGVWPFGDLTTYKPTSQVFYNDGTTQFMDYKSPNSFGSTNTNLPFLIPVTAGITYYFKIPPNAGNPSPANLTISTVSFTSSSLQAGDFINNREEDDSFEHPLTVMAQTAYTSRAFVQLAPPIPSARDGSGLPHGDQGAILNDGHFLYLDNGFLTGKIYDQFFNVVATVNYAGTHKFLVGSNRTSAHFYVAHQASPGGIFTIDELSTAGVLTNQWATTITSIDAIAVNNDATILYYATSSLSATIKSWNLPGASALPDIETLTSFSVFDILYLQDNTILIDALGTSGGAPHQVIAKQYATNGTILHTYDFGTLWRNDLNPPRIGYALDSPASFWIRLAPNADQGSDTFKHVKISDGSILDTFNQANYLFGQYIGTATATPPSRFGQEKAGALLVAPLGGVSPSALRPPWPLVPPFVSGVGGLETVPQRRLRVAPHLSAEQFNIFYDQFTLDLQVGNGLLVGQGVTPQIMLRMSDDGGYTWTDEILLDSGAQGQYLTRVTANGLGQARDRVFEISTSDPVSWSIIGAYLNTRKGRW
jgi:hypothetical protein